MLTFFVITTIINLALGYGLAIYLGQARRDLPGTVLPEQPPVDMAADFPPTSPVVFSAAAATPSPASPAPTPSLPGMPAAQLPVLVSPLQRSGPVGAPAVAERSPAEIPAVADPLENQTPVGHEPARTKIKTPGETLGHSRGTPEETADSQLVTDETLNVADIDDPANDHQRQLPDMDQASAYHPTAAITAETNPASPPCEEDLLAGIAAFRAQLSEVNPSTESMEDQGVSINAPPATVP